MHFSRVSVCVLAATLAVISVPRSACAQTKPGMPSAARQALATVQQFVGAFNKGDTKSAIATCAPRASIIDEFPPHEWQGSTACADWIRDFTATSKLAGITNAVVTLGAPWRIDVNGSRAYLVAPATYDYKVHGKPVTESNSILTVALQRLGGVWRMTGWAWTAH
jgi:hypothetical protein